MSLYADDPIPNTNDKLKILRDGSQVGTKARKLNFPPIFTVNENVAQNRYDILMAELAIAEAMLADNAVSTNKIANTAVNNAKLANSAVDANKLASDAVTTAKILNSNVTTAKIADNNVTTPKILDANVTNAKVAQITDMTKLPSTLAFESIEETGVIVGNDATPASMGYGLLSNPVNDTTPSQIADGNGGGHLNYNTTTTQETRVGLRTNRTITVRQVNPEFFCKFAIPSITALAGFIGFSSQSQQVNTDPALLTNVHGFGLTWRTTSSSLFRVSRNAGGATTTITDLATALTSNPISVWMKLSDDLAKIDYKIWTTSNADPSLASPTETGSATTNLPSTNIQMYYHFCTANVTTTSKTLDHWISKVRTTGENV